MVIDQQKPHGRFDEHKVMLGWKSPQAAKKAYLSAYSRGWQGFAGMVTMTVSQFRNWLQHGDTGKRIVGQLSKYSKKYAAGDSEEWEDNAETAHDGFPSRGHAYHFLQVESHPELAKEGNYRIEQRGPRWYITHPKSLLTAIRGDEEPKESTDMHDPAYPKVISWHNDIAYTVPVHPQALSKEHMQALADYEVHRRQHEKLEKQLHGEHDEYGDRPWVVSEEAARRLDRSQQQLHRLERLARGYGHAAVGPINPYHRFVRKTLYLPESHLYGRVSPEQFANSRAEAKRIYGDRPMVEIPTWAILIIAGAPLPLDCTRILTLILFPTQGCVNVFCKT